MAISDALTVLRVLLVVGDKAGQWNRWYDEAIPLAERRYEEYLKEVTL